MFQDQHWLSYKYHPQWNGICFFFPWWATKNGHEHQMFLIYIYKETCVCVCILYMLEYLSEPMWMVAVCWGPTSGWLNLQDWNWGNISTATLIFVVPCSSQRQPNSTHKILLSPNIEKRKKSHQKEKKKKTFLVTSHHRNKTHGNTTQATLLKKFISCSTRLYPFQLAYSSSTSSLFIIM